MLTNMLSPLFAQIPRLQVVAQRPVRMGEPDRAAVSVLQYALTALRYDMSRSIRPNKTLDGIFGQQTHGAVRKFQGDARQANSKMAIDGEIGPETLQALDQEMRRLFKDLKVPVIPPPEDLSLAPFVVTFDKTVTFRQPTNMGCWATAATMLYVSNNRGKFSRWDITGADDRIREVFANFDKKWLELYTANKGLTQSQSFEFWTSVMKLEPFRLPTGWAQGQPFVGPYAWKQLLSMRRRPLVQIWTTGGHGYSHAAIMFGVDPSMNHPNTSAPPFYNDPIGPLAGGIQLLPRGCAIIANPGPGLNQYYSIDDVDYNLARIPGASDVVNKRDRVFF